MGKAAGNHRPEKQGHQRTNVPDEGSTFTEIYDQIIIGDGRENRQTSSDPQNREENLDSDGGHRAADDCGPNTRREESGRYRTS